jgi:DNA polymerase IV (DinB-like DNA polymerase)
VIGHVDLDYFYAQIEEVQDPSIKGKPVLVCVFSGRTEDSGVVSTANYEARKLGIGSGMPIVLAKKKLKGVAGVIIPMHREKYEAVSEEIMRLVGGRVDVLEQTGIDEAFFDITKSSNGDYSAARNTAAGIKAAILNSQGLTASIGLGRSKIVAKMASDFVKPDGLTVVTPDSTMDFLVPLPVIKLYGVGPKTSQVLEELKIHTIGDLATSALIDLEPRFGRKVSTYLLQAAKGEDEDPVTERQETTQFSRIITLKQNTNEANAAFNELIPAIEELHQRLLSKGVSFRTLSAIGILTDLSTRTKSRTFESPAESLLARKNEILTLLQELTGTVDKELRRVGIRVSGLSDTENQTSLTQFC